MADHSESVHLYEVEWNGQDDYLPDTALDTVERLILARLPDSFDVGGCQARTASVTATVKFAGLAGPVAQQEAMDAMFQAATVVRTLHANLVAARAALASSGGDAQ
jgi:hypothetical protein